MCSTCTRYRRSEPVVSGCQAEQHIDTAYHQTALYTGERREEDVLGDFFTGGESNALSGHLVGSTGTVIVAVTDLALVYTQSCNNN